MIDRDDADDPSNPSVTSARADHDPQWEGDRRFEEALANALRGPDPDAAFAAIARDERLPRDARDALRHAPENGIRIAALLIVRLRFERIQQTSKPAADFFAADPRGFTAAFKQFHREVPSTELEPFADARRFEAWLGEACDGDSAAPPPA